MPSIIDELNNKADVGSVYKFQAPKKQPKKPNFIQSMLPSAGGLAGGVGGGALGGALAGSAILPGVGTVAGGLIGALLGGAAGGAAGKVALNTQMHEGALHDVAKEAALQGVLSAGPLRLLKGAGAATSAVKGGAGLADALTIAGERSAAPSALKTAVANKLDNTAENLAQRGLKINDSAWNTKFANRSGEEVGAFARRFNVPHNGLEATRTDVLQPGFAAHKAAIEAVGGISKKQVEQAVKDQVSKQISSKVPASQAFAKGVLKEAKGVLDNFGDSISASELNKVKTEIAGRVNHAATDTASLTTNKMLDSVSSGFRTAINDAAKSAGVKIDPSVAKLGFKSSDVGGMGEELRNLKTLLDKADVKSRVGTGSNPLSLPGVVAAGGIGGPAGIATGAAVQAINSTAGKKGIAKGIDAVARRADNAALKSATNPYGVKKVAARTLPVGLVGALSNSAGSLDQSPQNIQTDTSTTMSANPNNMLPSDYSGNAETSSDSPFAAENIEANVAQMVANGAKMADIKSYLDMAKSVQALTAASGGGKLNSTQLQQANNAQSGLTSLQTIADSLSSNPNIGKLASLPGGSLTSSLTGTGSYKAAVANATDVIGRLRSGGAINGDEEKRFMSLLPSTFDDPQTAQYKLSQVAALFQRFANPQAAQSDPASLLSALGA